MAELILPFGGAVRRQSGPLEWSGMATKAFADVRKQLAIRATVAELRSLDNRTLRDIGIHRSEINSIAWVGLDRIRGR